MEDKRAFNRLDIIGLAQIRRESSDLPLDAQIVDISYDGMRIYVKEPLSGRLEVSLCYLGDGTKQEIAEVVKGQVAWIKEKGLWYSIGIQFDGLNPQDHGTTLSFLDKWVKMK
jgi:hypothetical protein